MEEENFQYAKDNRYNNIIDFVLTTIYNKLVLLKFAINGFLIFFIIIMVAKILNYLIIGNKLLNIEENDFYLSLMGFVYVVLLELLNRVQDEKNNGVI